MTAQSTDRLRYDGQDLAMSSLPLDTYFALAGIETLHLFFPESSMNWRGYVGSWEIIDERLYLIGLRGTTGGKQASVATFFPGFPDRVFAHWFSGTICASRGKLLKYVHSGFMSVYEEDLFLDFDEGVLTKTEVRRNGSPSGANKSGSDAS